MIITPEYLRANYTGAAATTDAVATQCIRAAIGDVEQMIGQPVQVREIVWYFKGNGRNRVTVPFTLKVSSATLEFRASIDDVWEEVPDVTYERPELLVPDGLLRDGDYRMTADVGLADTVSPALLSADFTTDFRYEALRGVLCEMAAAKFYASATTNTGVKRTGLKSVSETSGPGTTKSQAFVEPREIMADWKRRLLPFKKLREI